MRSPSPPFPFLDHALSSRPLSEGEGPELLPIPTGPYSVAGGKALRGVSRFEVILPV